MEIDFYHMSASSPCRAVHMAAKEFGVGLNIINIDLRKGEQSKENFLKINPLHIVPTIDDNGLILWESAAIMTYFANKYGGANDKMYPKDPQKRAQVDKILHFYSGSLFASYFSYYAPQIMLRQQGDPELQKKFLRALDAVEGFLGVNDYLAGSHRTLGDLAVLATVVGVETFGADLSKWPKMLNWMKRMKAELPYYEEVNKQGLIEYKAWFLGHPEK